MGESEGKNVGQWFGPNTIAQVLRYLCDYLVIYSRKFLKNAFCNISGSSQFTTLGVPLLFLFRWITQLLLMKLVRIGYD